MRKLYKMTSLSLVAVLLAPPWAFASIGDERPEVRELLTQDALAQKWGGVMGGRIGNRNAGMLELKCGDTDEAFFDPIPAYQRLGETYYAVCPGTGRLAQLPHYNFNRYPQYAFNAAITRQIPTGSQPDPTVEVYLNGRLIATVPCYRSSPYDGGIATSPLGYNDLPLEAWSCPSASATTPFVRDIIPTVGGPLKNGLNTLMARTNSGDQSTFEDRWQDQEVRYFYYN